MTNWDPSSLAEWTGGVWNEASLPKAITGFAFDARALLPDQCFFALSGGARDGHSFVEQAVASGASAVVVERIQEVSVPQLLVEDSLVAMEAIGRASREAFAGPVVGVTGSCGKTSTKEMLRCLLGADRTHATEGNWNNRIGVPMTLFGLDAAQKDFAVVEAGINQPDEMEHLGSMIHADLNVLTNIGPAHLELLGSLENIAAEKSMLVDRAVVDSPIVLPASAMKYEAYRRFENRAYVLVETDEELHVGDYCDVVEYTLHRTPAGGYEVSIAGVSYSIASSSRGIACNAALAITAAGLLGISTAAAKARIESWQPSGSRGRVVTEGTQTFYVDCYNANPASMTDALEAFAALTDGAGARFFLIGAMNELGDHAEAAHRKIGEQLKIGSEDRVAFVGPDALTVAYLEGARLAGISESQLSGHSSIDSVKSTIATFEGAVFLKGSRSYQLEQVLPPALKIS